MKMVRKNNEKEKGLKEFKTLHKLVRTSCVRTYIRRMGFKEVKAPIGSVRKIFSGSKTF